jgi:hypothetical protein
MKKINWCINNFVLFVFSFLFVFGVATAVVTGVYNFLFDPAGKFVYGKLAEVKVARASEKLDKPIKLYVLDQVNLAGIDINRVDELIRCENRQWDTNANYVNYGNRRGVDRGLWMLNDISHKEVSNACAYNLECSTKAAIRIIKERGFKEWACGK